MGNRVGDLENGVWQGHLDLRLVLGLAFVESIRPALCKDAADVGSENSIDNVLSQLLGV